MAVSHVKSDTIADFTGTFTGFNSQGSTTTIAATDVVRPVDWNSAHNQFYTLTGNTTGNSTVSGTNVIWGATDGMQLSGSSNSIWLREAPRYYWANPDAQAVVGSQSLQSGSHWMQGFYLPYNLSAGRLHFLVNFSSASVSTYSFSASVSSQTSTGASGRVGGTWTLALWSRVSTGSDINSSQIVTFFSNTATYSLGGSLSCSWSTNVSSATASWTTSAAFGFISKIDSQGNFTTSSATSSGSSTFSSTSTNQNSFSTSVAFGFVNSHAYSLVNRILYFPFGTTLSAGEYWLGFNFSTSSGSTNASIQRQMMQTNASFMVPVATRQLGQYILFGSSGTYTTNTESPAFGTMSQTSATTTTQALSNVSFGGTTPFRMYFVMDASTY